MKKIVSMLLLLAMLLSLAACGGGGTSAPVSSEIASGSASEDGSGEETPAADPDIDIIVDPAPTSQEEEDDDPAFRNPLTGEVTETDISMKRPLAVMHNTQKKALPQSGCSKADILLEMSEEGGTTRVMGLYQDPTGVGDLGTIRSTREYYVFLAMGYDALMVHCGASTYGDAAIEKHNYKTIDEFYYGSLFWRDSWRQKNVGQEHSLYTSSDNLQEYLAKTDKFRADHEEGYTCPLVFTETALTGGDSAAKVNVSFSGYKDTEFVYNAETGKYDVFCFGGNPYKDANDDSQVAVTNVIVVVTEQYDKPGGTGHQEYDLSSGEGYFAWGGTYIPICWSKGEETAPLVFTNIDGTPLELGVGNSYICIVDDDRPVTFE